MIPKTGNSFVVKTNEPRLSRWLSVTRKFWRNRSGATAIEYALLVVGVGVAVLATVFALGNELDRYYDEIGEEMEDRFEDVVKDKKNED